MRVRECLPYLMQALCWAHVVSIARRETASVE